MNIVNSFCIYQLFEAQVELTPEAIAVVFEDEQLTYRQLNQRANQLAHYLRGLGVRPEVLVGICLERSLNLVVGLLAILKAGGAYVPLDPAYPVERLAFMVEDAQLSIILTQEKLAMGRLDFTKLALPQHPAVKQAVVIAREDAPNDKRLVAYVRLHPSQESAAQMPETSIATQQSRDSCSLTI